MSFLRLSPYRRRPSRTTVIVLGLSLWLTLGLISQAAFQLIG